jgi:PAS domain S-box-containing protein
MFGSGATVAASRLLIVAKRDSDARWVLDELDRAGRPPLEHRLVASRQEMASALVSLRWDAVICCISEPGFGPSEALDVLRNSGLDRPFLVVSQDMDAAEALALMRAGAHDVLGSNEPDRLVNSLERHIREAQGRSDKRLWENALRVSEERYRKLFERNLAGVYRAAEDGRLLECNESFARIFGFRNPGHAISQSLIERYVTPDDRDAFLSALRESGEIRNFEKEYRTTDGSTIWVLENASLVAVGNGGPEAHIEGTVIDITERRNAEERLLQAQKMEAVGRLAGGVAHDFNNLLQAILGAIQLAKMQRDRGGSDDDVLAEIKGLVSRGAQLARQLLLFSRREKPVVTPLDLSDVVTGVKKLLTRLLRENIRVEFQTADEPLPLIGDRSQLEQVLVNLAVNAADAMPDGGRLTIGCGDGAGDEAWLTVTDTGEGIAEEVRERVFEPFFTTKGRNDGTGLGLAVVHGIVTEHGGRIELSSEVGAGTTFRVMFPMTENPQQPETAPVEKDEGAAPGRGERVLIAEDEPDTRRWLTEDLVALGYCVTSVASAEETEHLLEEHVFDLLLSDCVLTGVGGPELARRLRKRWPELKVIFMSGYAEDQVIQDAIATTNARFLQKPFFIEDLATEMRNVLGGRNVAAS